MTSQIKLIVGLGNPGPEYAKTRHNAGAWYVEQLARWHNVSLREEPKFFGHTARIQVDGQDVRLLIPNTYMNLSGKAVAALARFYQIEPEAMLVAHDELDLPPASPNSSRAAATVATTASRTSLPGWATTIISSGCDWG